MNDELIGFEISIEGVYFSTFRKSTSSSLVLTYSIPPFTTIRGLIANAMGLGRLERDEGVYELQDKIKIGIAIIGNIEKSREMAKLLKLKEDKRKRRPSQFPSSPLHKEFIVTPSYKVFICGEKDIIERMKTAVNNPKRPLYLGQSDDLVDIDSSEIIPVHFSNSNIIHSIVEGIHENCQIEKIPYKFEKKGKGWELDYITISIPTKYPIRVKNEQEVFIFGEKNVCAY